MYYYLYRLVSAFVTLFILSAIVFFGTVILPGDVGRRILGGLASETAVAELNRQLGTDRPVIEQYSSWLGGLLHGDLGTSFSMRVPVGELLAPALLNSAILTLLILVLLLPTAIIGGVLAALLRGRPGDHLITVSAMAATTVPDFVIGILLLLVFSLGLGWFPTSATAPAGSGFLLQLHHLLLPALCMVIGLGGYVLRMVRAGVVVALESDYTRTAFLKGLSPAAVLFRHVLRNGLMSTVAVISSQIGYIFGGLVVIEVIFNYDGIGRLIYVAANQKDFAVLQTGIIIVGSIYFLVSILGDIVQSALDPRTRFKR